MAVSGDKLANPAPLGLICFGLTTVLLSLINAGILPKTGENVVIPLALAFGGTIQVIAGMMEFRTGNTFGMTAFMSYGAFWWWFALLLMLAPITSSHLTERPRRSARRCCCGACLQCICGSPRSA